MTRRTTRAVALLLGGTVFLSACEPGQMPGFLQGGGAETAPRMTGQTRLIERDVEAPEVFQITETGLWDGRPSLGGVWVAHSEAKDPERVIIRNEANGKFVIGALFRREREVPGPRFQVSSDAADALDMLAGAPVTLNVTALRREEVPDPDAAPAEELPATEEIEAATLDDVGEVEGTVEEADAAEVEAAGKVETNPIAAAAAALDEVEAAAEAGATTAITPPVPAASAPSTKAPDPAVSASAVPAPRPPTVPGLAKPFIQIGIFSVEVNASNTAESLRRAGMVPTIKPGTSAGKAFWRVLVGPATSASERTTLLKKIEALGFSDAYFVTH